MGQSIPSTLNHSHQTQQGDKMQLFFKSRKSKKCYFVVRLKIPLLKNPELTAIIGAETMKGVMF